MLDQVLYDRLFIRVANECQMTPIANVCAVGLRLLLMSRSIIDDVALADTRLIRPNSRTSFC